MLLSLSPFPQDGIIAQVGFLGKIWQALVIYTLKYKGTFYQSLLLQVFVVLCRKYIGTCFKSISKIELAWHRVDSSKRRNDVENLTLLSNVRSKILHY